MNRVISNKWQLSFILFLSIYLFSYILTIYVESFSSTSIFIRTVFYVYCFIIVAISLLKNKKILDYELFLFFYLISFLLLLVYHNNISVTSINATLFAPFSALAASFIFSKKSMKNKESFEVATTAFLIFYIVMNAFYYFNVIYLGLNQGLIVNTIYLILTCLPLMLFIKSFLLKVLITLLLIILSIAVGKNTPLLATVIILFILVWNRISKIFGNNFKLILTIFFTILINLILIYYVLTGLYDFVDLNEVSSGRVNIFKLVLSDIVNSNIVTFFMGHGFNSVALKYGMSSHNDFLEVMYNFGFFGFSLYLFIYFLFGRLIFNCYKKGDSKSILVSSAAFITFSISSFSSHLIFIPSSIIYIFISYSLCNSYISMENIDE